MVKLGNVHQQLTFEIVHTERATHQRFSLCRVVKIASAGAAAAEPASPMLLRLQTNGACLKL